MRSETGIKSFKNKKGNDVVFRYPTADDFQDMFSFACDLGSEDTFVALDAPPKEADERIFFDTMLRNTQAKDAIYISVYVNGVFAGNGRVDRGKRRHHHVGEMGISLRAAYRNEGIGTELMKSLIDEAKALGLRLLTLSCFENNAPALHVYEKLGFQKAGSIPEAIAFKGKYVNEVHMFLPLVHTTK